ncbi:MAG: hypothetical protein JGK30_24260 [Microcoleus sp. PH2017_40_RAT_O_B]|jgi:hypothetical protein|uniref:hypothetical protein n=1 Tax=unclassified Microcoleus TaxID=2642155 RepID=UPI001E19EE4F|nr:MULTISPECIES: hypothetical protein [unclassified Microcoleus]MCC3575423.1 hypothetical protein [Microcoleus sp. PH2017_34_RAT_O_A]MCC3612505.1 hypothetical protein [Microcoleus sp. PH2017_40_RAT_O_B]
MISTPKSVPELLREEIPDAPADKKPVRLLLCGTPKGVNWIVDILHILGFAKIDEWSPPLPSPISGEIMRILTRYFAE